MQPSPKWVLAGALVAALGVAGGVPAPAHAAHEMTCAASAARILALAEPARIDAAPCVAATRQAVSTGTGVGALLPVRVEALGARTADAGGEATAESGAARVTVGALGLRIEASELTARATARCAGGLLSTNAGGGIQRLSINGRTVLTGTDPLTIPLGVATLSINETTADARGITRRALRLQTLLGDVVVGEARAGVGDRGCEASPPQEPASSVTKTVDDADGAPVRRRHAAPGEIVRYRVTYRNNGETPARAVVLRDTLVDHALVDCSPACDRAGETAGWTLGDVEAGGRREVEVRARVPATAAVAGVRTFRNVASATDQRGDVESPATEVDVRYAPDLQVTYRQQRLYEESSPDEETDEPLAIDEGVAAGDAGIGYRLRVENRGTAPATDLVLRDALADAFVRSECLPARTCTLAALPGAQSVLEPAGGPGTRSELRQAELAIGAASELRTSAMLATGDYAAAETVLRSAPEVTSAQGSVHVAALEARARTEPSFELAFDALIDRDGDGNTEPGDAVRPGELVPPGTPLSLDLWLAGLGAQATDDAVLSVALPDGVDPAPDPCAAAEAELGCAYDAATRSIRLVLGRVGSHDVLAPRLLVRARPGYAGPVDLGAAFSSARFAVDSPRLAFRVG